jgi:hypothetical protein
MAARYLLSLEKTLAHDETDDSLATALVILASLAGRDVYVDDDERHGATRRALLLLAAGGDPSRGLDLHGRAVTALAEELRDIDRQLALEAGLRELRLEAAGLPHVNEAVRALVDAPEIAWRAYVCSLLAEELGADDGDV